VRIYRALLRLYPTSFRDEYGDEMTRTFARERQDARGPIASALLWCRTIADVVINALRVHADVLRQDLRVSFRALRRTPGFTAAALIVTALGVGATTAAVTLTDHVLLRPLPYPDSARLVKIWQGPTNRPANLRGLRGTNDVSPALFLAWKGASTSFSAMGAYGFTSSNLAGDGEPERLDGAVVMTGTMETVGVPVALGRSFTPQEDVAGAPCSVLISDGLWRRHFGADRSAIGRRVRMDEELCEVVGVMPRGFSFPTRTTAFWKPARFPLATIQDYGDTFLRVIARLRWDTTVDRARTELTGASANALRTWPKEFADAVPVMLELRDEINDQSRLLLIAMAGAAACLLLIACTNLASLTVARATARRRELALRTALGAGHHRLVRQLLTESLVLAGIGGAIGLVIAVSAIPTAARLVPTALPITEIPGVDVRMLAIAAIATLGTGVAFGVLPALRAARRTESAELREGARSGTDRASTRLRDGLVMLQVAMSIVLLVGTGLLIRALVRVQATPSGFSSDRVVTARTFLSWSKYGEQAPRTEFYRRVLADVAALPGVTAVAYTSYLPFTFRGGVWEVAIPGRVLPPGRTENASSRIVTPLYFRAMNIPLIAGRLFEESDSMQSLPVAIVSQSFVTTYLDGRQPLGQTFKFGPVGELTIVGVVGDVRFRGLEARSEPQVYLCYLQQGDNRVMGYTPKDLVVRIGNDRPESPAMDAIFPAIRRIVWKVDPDQPVSDLQALATIVEGETTARSVQVRVLAGFAGVSCLLAGVGLHGLLAFVVSRRTREFGVRLALGAEPRQIVGLVARRGLILGIAGVVAGVWVAYAAGRWMESLLAGLSPADPMTFASAIGFSLAITLAGSLLPALRAARISPKQAIDLE
jgi:putative ABC transport system permease protein